MTIEATASPHIVPALFNRIRRNIGKKALAEMIPRLLSFAITAFLARRLGNSGFGQIAYGLAVAGVVSIFLDFGWNNATLRHLAIGGDTGFVGKVIRLKVIAALVAIVVVLSLSHFILPSYISLSVLFWLLLVGVANAFQDFWGAVSTGLEKIQWEVAAKTLSRGMVLLGLPLFWLKAATPYNAAVFLAAGNGIGAALAGVWIVRRLLPPSAGLAPKTRAILREGVTYGVTSAVWTFYTRQDILLLGFFHRPANEVGYYAIVSRLLEFGRALPLVLQTALIPVFSSLVREPERVSNLVRRLLTALLPVAALMALGAMLVGPKMIQLFFGPSFLPAAKPFVVAACGLSMMMLNVCLIAALIGLKQERYLLFTVVMTALVNALVNGILIPRLSYMGSAWANLTSETVWLVLNIAAFLFHLRRVENVK